ncbi:MAG: efflux RND transporter permease subunit [Acidobacteriota bacterium]
MNLIDLALRRPVTVTVGVLLLLMFGLIGLQAIPVQLVPDVDRPVINVNTPWPGRSPQEVVEDVTKAQEEQLKNVSNLESMKSVSSQGGNAITLEFYLGTDISRALQEVSDALRRVPSYPDEVDEPAITTTEGSDASAITWIIFDVDPADDETHPDFDVSTIQDALFDEVKPYLERIDGVAKVNIYGGREREARVLADSAAMAQRGVTHGMLVTALRNENRDVSAGSVAEGKRDWRVRVTGRFRDLDVIRDTIVTWGASGPVRVKDLATVELGHAEATGFVRSFGRPCLAMNMIRQSGANVLDVMTEVRARMKDVEADFLPGITGTDGPRIRMRMVYDETTYLDSAIGLVTSNLWLGGGLAALVLLLFLRSFTSTAVIALAIPTSVIGTFLVLLAMGRTLNIVSLAGLAFSVGLVVDNAIVVLENIYRHLQSGRPPLEAARRGAAEVWGAILASTLTTVAVFVPVLTIQEEAGQLFRDISLAVVASVTLSLIVSITVIPTACSRWLRPKKASDDTTEKGGRVGAALERFIRSLVTGAKGATLRPLIILAMTVISLGGAWLLAPPLDYLPAGNRNLVFGGLLIPPGYSVSQQELIAQRIEKQVLPYAQADITQPETLESLPPIPRFDAPGEMFAPAGIENFFLGAFGNTMFVGATSQDDQIVRPVGNILTIAMNTIPDAFGGAFQASIFGMGAGAGNSIDLEISGPELDRVVAAASAIMGQAGGRYGFRNVQPTPTNFNLGQPEWQVVLEPAGREMGFSTADLGLAVRSLVDGAKVDEIPYQGRTLDLVLLPAGGRLSERSALLDVPVATPRGGIVALDSVAEVHSGLAPQEIQRIEELPSVTIAVVPPPGAPVEQVMRELTDEIIGPARTAGLIDPTMRIRLEGTAAKLDEVRQSLFGQASSTGLSSRWQRVLAGFAAGILLLGALLGVIRFHRAKSGLRAYALAGIVLLAAVLSGLGLALAFQPESIQARFVWSLAVTYLVTCALFESFLYPLVIMFSVPLAIVGGFAGLALVHAWTVNTPVRAPQQLDVLTMLGFVILIGVVVNNAILLVHRALQLMRGEQGATPLPPAEAIGSAVRTRLRPIFMSTLTSVGGMLPLVLVPGSGSEMYRGLGSVVVGGLLVSTVFTLLLVPLTFSLVLDMAAGVRSMLGLDKSAVEPETAAAQSV